MLDELTLFWEIYFIFFYIVIRNTRDDVVVGGEEASEGRLSLIKSNASRIQNKQVGVSLKEKI